jgi:hypothetical protein
MRVRPQLQQARVCQQPLRRERRAVGCRHGTQQHRCRHCHALVEELRRLLHQAVRPQQRWQPVLHLGAIAAQLGYGHTLEVAQCQRGVQLICQPHGPKYVLPRLRHQSPAALGGPVERAEEDLHAGQAAVFEGRRQHPPAAAAYGAAEPRLLGPPLLISLQRLGAIIALCIQERRDHLRPSEGKTN